MCNKNSDPLGFDILRQTEIKNLRGFSDNLAEKLYLCTHKTDLNFRIMQATRQFRGPLNDAQMSVMRLLGHMKSVEEVEELRQVISDYYRRKIEEGMDQLWASGEWSEQRIDEILKEDVHANRQTEHAE